MDSEQIIEEENLGLPSEVALSDRNYENVKATNEEPNKLAMKEEKSFPNVKRKYAEYRRRIERKLEKIEDDISIYNRLDMEKLTEEDKRKIEERKKNLESRHQIIILNEEIHLNHRVHSISHKPIKVLKSVYSKIRNFASYLNSKRKEKKDDLKVDEFDDENIMKRISEGISESLKNFNSKQKSEASSFSEENSNENEGLYNLTHDEIIQDNLASSLSEMNIGKDDDSIKKEDSSTLLPIESTELNPIKQDNLIVPAIRENVIIPPERSEFSIKEPSTLEEMARQADCSSKIDELTSIREGYMNEIRRREQLRQEAENKRLKEAEARKEAEKAEVELKEKLRQASEKLASIKEQNANLEHEIQISSTEEQTYIGKKQEAMRNFQELDDMLSEKFISNNNEDSYGASGFNATQQGNSIDFNQGKGK